MTNDHMKAYSGLPNSVQSSDKNREVDVCAAAISKFGPISGRLDNLITWIIANSPITVFALDDDGVVNLCTGHPGELTGFNPQDLVGQSVYDICGDISNSDTFFPRLFSEETGVTSINFRGAEFDVWHTPMYDGKEKAINNIQCHSRADRAEIRLTQQGEWLRIEIQDWGIGFDPSNVDKDRFGLQGIRERARLMRGRVVIDSAPGKGTQIIVELPVA